MSVEMWKDGRLTSAALELFAKENQKRLKEAQKFLGDPTQGAIIGPKGAELMPKNP
jgi:hypothetical protein